MTKLAAVQSIILCQYKHIISFLQTPTLKGKFLKHVTIVHKPYLAQCLMALALEAGWW